MSIFAELNMDPGGIIAWVVVGLIAGFLAGRVMRGSGYGLVGDLVVGLIGAVVGGFLAGLILPGTYGLAGSILVAFLGACLLISVLRAIAPGRTVL